jgi:hypothetical protein
MKNIFARTGSMLLTVLMILGGAGCQTGANVAGNDQSLPAGAITNVLTGKERAGLSCARILIDNEKIVSVHLHGGQYITALKKLDASGCPENFRQAWSDYIAAWQRKQDQEHATDETLDAISMWKGDFNDLAATVRCIEAYDTEKAWQNCERVALECGVDASKLNVN